MDSGGLVPSDSSAGSLQQIQTLPTNIGPSQALNPQLIQNVDITPNTNTASDSLSLLFELPFYEVGSEFDQQLSIASSVRASVPITTENSGILLPDSSLELEEHQTATDKNKAKATDKMQTLEQHLVRQRECLAEKEKKIKENKAGRNFFKYLCNSRYRTNYRINRNILLGQISVFKEEISKSESQLAKYKAQEYRLSERAIILASEDGQTQITKENAVQARANLRSQYALELHQIFNSLLIKPWHGPDSLDIDIKNATYWSKVCERGLEQMELFLEDLQVQRRQIKSTSSFFSRTRAERKELTEISRLILEIKKTSKDLRRKRITFLHQAMTHKFFIQPSSPTAVPSTIDDNLTNELHQLKLHQHFLIKKINDLSFNEIKLCQDQKALPQNIKAINKAFLRRAPIDENDPNGGFIDYPSVLEQYQQEIRKLESRLDEIPQKLERLRNVKNNLIKELYQLQKTIKKTKPLANIQPRALALSRLKYDNARTLPEAEILKLPEADCMPTLVEYSTQRLKLHNEMKELWQSKRNALRQLEEIKQRKNSADQQWKIEKSDSSYWKRSRDSVHKTQYDSQKLSHAQAIMEAELEKETVTTELNTVLVKMAERKGSLANLQAKHAKALKKHNGELEKAQKKQRLNLTNDKKLTAVLQPAYDLLNAQLQSLEIEIKRLTAEKNIEEQPVNVQRFVDIDLKLADLKFQQNLFSEKIDSLNKIAALPSSKTALGNAKPLVQEILAEARARVRQEANQTVLKVKESLGKMAQALTNIKTTEQTSSAEEQTAALIVATQDYLDTNDDLKNLLTQHLIILEAQYKEVKSGAGWLERNSNQREELETIKQQRVLLKQLLVKANQEISALSLEMQRLKNLQANTDVTTQL